MATLSPGLPPFHRSLANLLGLKILQPILFLSYLVYCNSGRQDQEPSDLFIKLAPGTTTQTEFAAFWGGSWIGTKSKNVLGGTDTLHLTSRYRGGNGGKPLFDGWATNFPSLWDSLVLSLRLRTLPHI
ncbi:hypothetical protein JAAARDRAFT_197237 [Jaapia argillacea MUCL 33604]|uniref:Uncharacterized protein n=1 Tax=Jaapia argillacea MUCL 33604 TaxID=933084 RepID=A0A067PIX7_9AGAM|nr:hypothetical protein JAAARDRAFT_197237 [Jaapia argillacea MUCL 33604]